MDLYTLWWIDSSFWLLEIKLLRMFIYESLCGDVLSFLLGKYSGNMVGLFLTF